MPRLLHFLGAHVLQDFRGLCFAERQQQDGRAFDARAFRAAGAAAFFSAAGFAAPFAPALGAAPFLAAASAIGRHPGLHDLRDPLRILRDEAARLRDLLFVGEPRRFVAAPAAAGRRRSGAEQQRLLAWPAPASPSTAASAR